MAKTNDEIMDEVTARLAATCDLDPTVSLLDGTGEFQDTVLESTYLIEAYQAGKDLTLAKLAYVADDMKSLPLKERVERASRAIIFSDNWQQERAA
ncbi:hypothetical protein [Sphingomonas sp. Ag1]|uniref:hypothetical protein n=1 Tax=Sphingomonas sp. Ag1 TaxID=1642949 RepID=UPI0012E08C24|nr:hypothetical protein [Sphingomonas sp. Ag1]